MTTMAGSAAAKPPRVIIADINSGVGYSMQFMPEEFEEKVTPNYSRHKVLGLSHEILQYAQTGNHTLPGIEFNFRADRAKELDLIHKWRRFFLSLCYASEGAETVRDGAPPRVLFSWPKLYSMTCIIADLSIRHKAFDVKGLTKKFTVIVTLEEIRDVRLTREQVFTQGTRRPSSGAQTTDLDLFLSRKARG